MGVVHNVFCVRKEANGIECRRTYVGIVMKMMRSRVGESVKEGIVN